MATIALTTNNQTKLNLLIALAKELRVKCVPSVEKRKNEVELAEEDIRNGILTKVGFQTNKKTKQDIVDAFLVAFEDGHIQEPDERFYTEAGIYEQRPDGSYGNIIGKDNHDDIVMTNMIAWYVHERMDTPKLIPAKDKSVRISRHKETINESTL